jgi:hypothetical protein
MKKALAILMLIAGTSALAHGPVYRPHPHYSHGYGWVVPTIIGGVVGYEIARQQQPVVVQQQPVIVQNPPIVYQPQSNCGPWIETLNSDGTITRSRTCMQ